MGGMPSDLAILSVAANQLFQSTEHMGTEAVVCILTGLRSVSNRALPTAFQLPSQSRCVSTFSAAMVQGMPHACSA